MNRSILKELNKNLSKNHYVRKIQSGKVFFGVSLSTLVDPSNVDEGGVDTFSSLEVDSDGEMVIKQLDKKNISSIDIKDNFGVTMELINNVKQGDKYTFLIKIEEVELEKSDELDKPIIRVKSNCIMPFWIDGSDEMFQKIQQTAIEQCVDTVLGIIVNTSDVQFAGVKVEGCGEYLDTSNRSKLLKQLPKVS
jgi:hypothetical protein